MPIPSTASASPKSGQDDESLFFGLMLVFAMFWSFFLLVFTYVIFVRGAVQQSRTRSFAETQGDVRKCGTKLVEDDDGNAMTKIDIEYVYRVDDRDFVGGGASRLASEWENAGVAAFVAAHPVGSRIAVYYDPADPSDSVLAQGFDGRELFFSLAICPFYVVMFGLWRISIAGIRGGGMSYARLYEGVQVLRADSITRVRMPSLSPGAAALFSLGLASIGLSIAVALRVRSPSVGVVAGAWAAVLSIVWFAYRRRGKKIESGVYDVIVDCRLNTLTVPKALLETDTVVIPLDELDAVSVTSKYDSENGRTFSIEFGWRSADGQSRSCTLTHWTASEIAHGLHDWIRSAVPEESKFKFGR